MSSLHTRSASDPRSLRPGDHQQPLRVLLISPVPELDPMSGDITYTRQLLEGPPPGILYTTYNSAIHDGRLTELGTRLAVSNATGVDKLLQLIVAVLRKFESLFRATGWAYRERIRVFRVQPDAFDLIHVHVFHHRFVGQHPPVVSSSGGPLRWVYSDAWGWSRPRLGTAEAIDAMFGWLWDATMCGSRPGRTALYIALSEYLAQTLRDRGWPRDRVVTQPNYMADAPPSAPRAERPPKTLGFVARDFEAKGGQSVLESFKKLRAKHPDLRLRIVGSPPRMDAAARNEDGIEWIPEVDRKELLQEILPSIDILLYPSRCDTGMPYSSMEALAAGIPAIVSDYRALPELVGDQAGAVCPGGDPDCLVAATEKLLSAQAWTIASKGALLRFKERFSATSQATRLGEIYRSVLHVQP